MSYAIGIAVICGADTSDVAVVVERDGRHRAWRWQSDHTDAHAAVVEAVARARALPLAADAPRVIYVRQQSVVTHLRDPDVRWSSTRAPGGEHHVVTAAAALLTGEGASPEPTPSRPFTPRDSGPRRRPSPMHSPTPVAPSALPSAPLSACTGIECGVRSVPTQIASAGRVA